MTKQELREYRTAWQNTDYAKHPEKYIAATRRHRITHPPASRAIIGPHRKLGRALQTICRRGHELTEDNVYTYVATSGENVRQCKHCVTDKNKRRAPLLRISHLKRNFHWTLEQHDAMLLTQGGGCKVCDTKEPGGMGAFHIDHDHNCCPGKKCCGKCIRGLLCRRCNDTLGKVADSIELLKKMIAYLEQFK